MRDKTYPLCVWLIILSFVALLAACGDGSQSGAAPGESLPREGVEQGSGVQLLPQEHWLDHNRVYVFDASGSMADSRCSGSQSKLEVAKPAILSSATASMDTMNVGLIVFNGGWNSPRVELPLSKDKAALSRLVGAVTTGGGTPLKEAISLAVEQLTAQMALQNGYGWYELVVVTDGEAQDVAGMQEVVKQAVGTKPIRIGAIGFCTDQGHSLNMPGYTSYVAASNAVQLEAGLKGALAETPVFDSKEFRAQ